MKQEVTALVLTVAFILFVGWLGYGAPVDNLTFGQLSVQFASYLALGYMIAKITQATTEIVFKILSVLRVTPTHTSGE